ncbi:pyruvate dehydrogenase E2 component (dihydrolipoamide acetyltransferase) [Nocardiopsis mwathae]|uniref:Dihydrolipoamide acetyltransferase component of pyruvate dehydrogenase complex n=1 Tax=Nocardiopsis mwathae TaxID=1472723 RepID=A0A7X0D4P3_9ACTN|nr:pyruvate dehydrogenase E2 component (dihydrolipoamide acetyltransferase) [Nocardiopsis mwathae]
MTARASSPGSVRDFALPDLGEGLTEAEIVGWRVAVGDEVAVDEPVVEVETAKASVEVPCPFGGRVVALHGGPGEVIAVGAPLISIDTSASAPGADAGFGEPGVVVPGARGSAETGGGGNGATAGTPGSGAVLVGYGTGEGAPRRSGGRRRAPSADGTRTTASASPSPPPGAGRRTAVVSPLVRRMAREHGIDAASLRGSGEGGLVLRRDVLAAIEGRERPSAAAGVPSTASDVAAPGVAAVAPRAVPSQAGTGEEERIPLRGVRATMAERLTRSRREIPEATVWVDADATGLLELRAQLNAADPQRPVSVLALLAKFCLLGLRRYPALNGRVDTERSELVRFGRVHLGFAAQTPRGLMVPVVGEADRMTTRELAAEMSAATSAARAGSLPPSRLTGGTFTVNNYGVFGVDGSAAIINHPEVAIVGMGRIVKRPWVVGEDVVARPVTELTLAFDHRVCDGEEAGGFLRFVADCVERPGLLLGDL